ncbi:MAG: alpha/beta hydrolase, partial [Erysipelotrichaceae bacterium]|nr:alpha/beta hydrolase [Erysipelotrichaceae bacterium]
FAKDLCAHNIGAFIFDFCGGSYVSRSDGKTTEMSVLSEAEDLETVIDHFQKDERIEKILLMGKSQGAYVSTLVASKRPKEIAGLIGLYSGFMLRDKVEEELEKYEEIPEEEVLLWLKVGRKYFEDLLSTDIYESMKHCSMDVLLIHGDKDDVAPISYSEKALNYFPKARLVTLKGADHGFHGPEREDVVKRVREFVQCHI